MIGDEQANDARKEDVIFPDHDLLLEQTGERLRTALRDREIASVARR